MADECMRDVDEDDDEDNVEDDEDLLVCAGADAYFIPFVPVSPSLSDGVQIQYGGPKIISFSNVRSDLSVKD